MPSRNICLLLTIYQTTGVKEASLLFKVAQVWILTTMNPLRDFFLSNNKYLLERVIYAAKLRYGHGVFLWH